MLKSLVVYYKNPFQGMIFPTVTLYHVCKAMYKVSGVVFQELPPLEFHNPYPCVLCNF